MGERPEAAGKRGPIVEAALRLFGEHGFDATSVQEVVEAAGATKGAFYHYFRSKEDLLHQLHLEFTNRVLGRFRAVAAKPAPPAAALTALVEEMLAAVDEDRQWMVVLFQEQRRLVADGSFGDVARGHRELQSLLAKVVREGVRTGEFRPVASPNLVANAIIGMCAWGHFWYEPGRRHSARSIARTYAELVVDGLRTR